MARSYTRQGADRVRNDLGDEVGRNAVRIKPFALGERTEANKDFYDAVKDYKDNFQKLVAISAKWQDGLVSPEYKVALKDAYQELPQRLKDLITDPPETIRELYRGTRGSIEDLIRKAEDDFIDKDIPDNDYGLQMIAEQNQRIADLRASADVMGFTGVKGIAEKFGTYVINGAEDMDDLPDAIINTKKLQELVESVFKKDSISSDYDRRSIFRSSYAAGEDEHIVIGAKLKYDALEMTDEWKEKRVVQRHGRRDDD